MYTSEGKCSLKVWLYILYFSWIFVRLIQCVCVSGGQQRESAKNKTSEMSENENNTAAEICKQLLLEALSSWFMPAYTGDVSCNGSEICSTLS